MVDVNNINWFDFLSEVKSMTCSECSTKYGAKWLTMWNGLQTAKSGEVVIRIIEGGNEYMKTGDSACGITPGLEIGVPVVIKHPNGAWYKGGTIVEIDWEKEIFRTGQSAYSFHFVKR